MAWPVGVCVQWCVAKPTAAAATAIYIHTTYC